MWFKKQNIYCVIWVLTATGSHKTCWGALILLAWSRPEFLTAGEKLLIQAHRTISQGWETTLQPCPKNPNRNRPRHWGFKRDHTHGLNMFKHGHYIPETKAPFLLRNRLRIVGASPQPVMQAADGKNAGGFIDMIYMSILLQKGVKIQIRSGTLTRARCCFLERCKSFFGLHRFNRNQE